MKSKEGSQARAESRSRKVAQSGITQQVRRAKGQNRAGGGKSGPSVVLFSLARLLHKHKITAVEMRVGRGESPQSSPLNSSDAFIFSKSFFQASVTFMQKCYAVW